ncbi:uncharacterized protein LOC125820939 [Solanum verrucosum]|uniref:uncharacterized protein LOC125820939 n=1 Tax=Solanum verrucosum TaxID=315347 RepID=UPI0020D18E66|nr:uncharacterized protein LOC125820939 [Solanum verrucosum]
MALFCKLWWNFRTKKTLWSEYMRNKYYRNKSPNLAMWKVGGEGSQVWKKMLQARDLIEHQILWQIRKGSTSFWHDNWTGLGDLYTNTGENFEWDDNYKMVDQVVHQGEWDVQTLMSIIPAELVEYIISIIKPPRGRNEEDIPCWMLETKGNFSVKTAWNYIRHKEEPN